MLPAEIEVVSGAISASPFAGLVSGFGVIVAVQAPLVKEKALSWWILIPGVTGFLLSAVGLVFPLEALGYLALALFIVGVLITAITASKVALPAPLTARLPHSRPAKGAVIIIALAFALGIGFAIGSIIGGGSSTPTVEVPPGPYHVENTCFDGNCTVNVCEDPEACGEENVGELHEGTAIEIQCQTTGGVVQGSAGEESRIWDRLSSGFYISDLFVGETKYDRFTRSIPRCKDA